MKILFIHSVERAISKHGLLGQGHLQFGISYISALLKEAEHQTDLLVLNGEIEGNAIRSTEEVLNRISPDVVAITCVSTQFPFIDRIARFIRRTQPDIYLVIGGPHMSLHPEDAETSVYDAVCIGEGEYPMLELTAQLAATRHPSGIGNLWLRNENGFMEKNPVRPFLQDLDALPFPDRSMWDPWVDTSDPNIPTVLLGRGCPHLCTYCSNHALHRLAEGRYVRFRTPQNIIAEIEELRKSHSQHVHTIFLEIDTITADKKWTFHLCEELKKYNRGLQKPLRFHCNFRITPHSSDEALFQAMAEATIRHLNIGLESGSERLRREVLHRNYSNEEFRQTIALARKYGMEFSLFNMIGIPGETPEDHLQTVQLNRDAQAASSLTSIFYPYPGTDLHRVCTERGLIPAQIEMKSERRSAFLDLPEFPRRSVQRAYDLFEWRITKGYLPLHVRIRKLLRHSISKSDSANRLFNSVLPIWHAIHAQRKP